jgi:hypothetical protein
MNSHQSITDLEVIEAPWNKTVTLQEIAYEGGVKMLRLRIKEGSRFTDLELDAGTLGGLTKSLQEWLDANG